jgi:DNA-binding CsgD family transcriptional regulator
MACTDGARWVKPIRTTNCGRLQRTLLRKTASGHDRTAIDIPGGLEVIRQMIGQGEEARVAEGLPMKMLIADGALGLVPLRSADATAGIVMIHPSALLDALIALFEAFWRVAMPIRRSGPISSASLTDQEEALLALLSAGMTDAAIAGHLGIGRRTVQRRIRGLMDRHGAQSRPQLLLRAAAAQERRATA